MKIPKIIKIFSIIGLLFLLVVITINSAFSINYDYWRENSTTIWVKVNLTAGQTLAIRILNQSGYAPNGDNVFEFFDDFNENNINTSKWDSGYDPSFFSIENGKLKVCRGGSTNNNLVALKEFNTYGLRRVVVFNVYNSNNDVHFGYIDDDNNVEDYFYGYQRRYDRFRYYSGSEITHSISDTNNYIRVIDILKENKDMNGIFYFNGTNTILWNTTDNCNGYLNTPFKPVINGWGSTSNICGGYVDYYFITKYDDSANITINCNNNICEITSNKTLTNYQIPLTTTYSTGNLSISLGTIYKTNYNISFAEYVSKKNVFNEERVPFGLCLADNETKMIITGYTNKKIHIYNLSEKYNISTAVLSQSRLISDMLQGTNAPQIQLPFDVYLNNNGTELFILDEKINIIYHWKLLKPFDLYSSQFIEYFNLSNLTIPGEINGITYANSIFFSEDGSYLYVDKWNTNKIFQFNLTKRWNLSSQQYYNKIQLSSSEYAVTLRGFVLSYDGKYLYAFFNGNNFVYQLEMPKNFDITTLIKKYEKNFSSNISNAGKVWITRDGRYLYLTETNSSGYIYQYKISDYTPKEAKITAYSWKTNENISNFNMVLKSGRIEYNFENSTGNTNIYYEFDKRKWNITLSNPSVFYNITYYNILLEETNNLNVSEYTKIYAYDEFNKNLIYNITAYCDNKQLTLGTNEYKYINYENCNVLNISHENYLNNYITTFDNISLFNITAYFYQAQLTIKPYIKYKGYNITNYTIDITGNYSKTITIYNQPETTINISQGNYTITIDGLLGEHNGYSINPPPKSFNIYIEPLNYYNKSIDLWEITFYIQVLNQSNLAILNNIEATLKSLDYGYQIYSSTSGNLLTINGNVETYNTTATAEGYENSTNLINTSLGSTYTFYVYPERYIIMSFKDERTLEPVNNVSLTISNFLGEGYNFTNINGNFSYKVNSTGEYIIIYEAPNYHRRTYYVYVKNKAHNEVDLYLLPNDSLSYPIAFTVYNSETGSFMEGALVDIYRYYPNEGIFRFIATAKTGTGGIAYHYLDYAEPFYKTYVRANISDNPVQTSEPQILYSQTYTLTYNRNQQLQSYNDIINQISYHLNYSLIDNNTLLYTYTFENINGILTTSCLEIYNVNNWNKTLINKECQTSTGATLYYQVNLTKYPHTIAEAYLNETNYVFLTSSEYNNENPYKLFNLEGLFITFLITIILFMIGIMIKAEFGVVGLAIGIIISYIFGMYIFSLAGIVFLIILIIYMVVKQ